MPHETKRSPTSERTRKSLPNVSASSQRRKRPSSRASRLSGRNSSSKPLLGLRNKRNKSRRRRGSNAQRRRRRRKRNRLTVMKPKPTRRRKLSVSRLSRVTRRRSSPQKTATDSSRSKRNSSPNSGRTGSGGWKSLSSTRSPKKSPRSWARCASTMSGGVCDLSSVAALPSLNQSSQSALFIPGDFLDYTISLLVYPFNKSRRSFEHALGSTHLSLWRRMTKCLRCTREPTAGLRYKKKRD